MKKLICVGAFLLLSGAAVMAQSSGSSGSGSGMMSDQKMKDCLMMKDGKVMVCKGGMSMPLMKDTTLRHGVMVSMDGTVKKKDGSTYMLKEGESVMGNGKVMMAGDKMSGSKM
ncbi:MAG TPA: DUF6799 domain-containing protein [Puia sp.]|nr:DUF6799 domain-containing protein [Puia sp.]